MSKNLLKKEKCKELFNQFMDSDITEKRLRDVLGITNYELNRILDTEFGTFQIKRYAIMHILLRGEEPTTEAVCEEMHNIRKAAYDRFVLSGMTQFSLAKSLGVSKQLISLQACHGFQLMGLANILRVHDVLNNVSK